MISIFKNWEILHPAYKNNKSSTGSYIKVIEEPREDFIFILVCAVIWLYEISENDTRASETTNRMLHQ